MNIISTKLNNRLVPEQVWRSEMESALSFQGARNTLTHGSTVLGICSRSSGSGAILLIGALCSWEDVVKARGASEESEVTKLAASFILLMS